jgi:hypothetical protein
MKFKEFKGNQPTVKPMGIPVDGTFRCQLCPLTVDEAEYFQIQRVLRWKCEEGHVSLIEKFDL